MATGELGAAFQALRGSLQQGRNNQQDILQLGVRKQRNDALTAVGNRRNDIAQNRSDIAQRTLEAKFTGDDAQKRLEDENALRTSKLKEQEIKTAQAEKDDFDRKDFKTIEDHLAKSFGGNAFPDMVAPFKALLDTVTGGQDADADGNYSVATVREAFKALNDPKNPFPGGGKLQKDIIQAGLQQGQNKVEVLKADLAKMVEKNPMLGTNPEAVKADPKAAEAQEGIAAITQVVDGFRNFKSEIDAFTKQSQSEIEQEKEAAALQANVERLEERGRTQDVVNQARGGAKKRDIVSTTDNLGRRVLVNRQTGEQELLPEVKGGQGVGKTGRDLISEINRDRANLLITPEQILTGTGLGSNVRSAFSALAGTFGFPGEAAPKTAEAKNNIRSFNQSIKADLTINARNPVAELRTIEDFLIDEKSNVQDPDTNITKTINLVKRLEGDVIKFQDTLNRGNVTKEQNIDFTNKINSRLGILSQIPTIAGLKFRSGRLSDMSIEEIESIPAEGLTEGQVGAMIRRMNQLGVK
jgi:hypothetical protein